jgi:hypothetical protein
MNERQYKAALAKIERNNPGEPLLSTLRGGWSKINMLYIGIALKRMPTVIDDEDDEPEEVAPVGSRTKNVQSKTPDDVLRGLWAERTRLFGEMNKQSNLFHACKSDEDRAANSEKVLGWWKDILRVKGNILHYEEYGELPKSAAVGDELSDNAVSLGKQLSSIRARISQTQAKITEVASLDPNTPGKEAKIQDYEVKLRDLKHLRGLAEQKLKSYEQT